MYTIRENTVQKVLHALFQRVNMALIVHVNVVLVGFTALVSNTCWKGFISRSRIMYFCLYVKTSHSLQIWHLCWNNHFQ